MKSLVRILGPLRYFVTVRVDTIITPLDLVGLEPTTL